MSETIDRPDTELPRGKPARSDTKPDRIDRAETDAGRSRRDGADRDNDDDKGKQADGGKGKPRSRLPLIIAGILAVVAIVGGVAYWLMTRGIVSTDDAYTDGNSIVVAPKISGYVTERDVRDNEFVKAGQILFKIDPREYMAARDQAQANLSLARDQLASAQVDLEITRVRAPATLAEAQSRLAQARATQMQAEQNYRRQHSVDPRATTQTNIDQANAQLKSETAAVGSAEADVQTASLVQQTIQNAEDAVKQREAQVAQAQANLAEAEVNLSYTVVRAPQDGMITKRSIDRGSYVQAGQTGLYIVPPDVWVTANFKENELGNIKPGEKVAIDVDAYPNLHLHGHVDSIQDGSGAQFSAFPAENATGNYVKIVRRVPVKIDIDSGLPAGHGLPLGLSVEPTITLQ